MTNSLIFVCLRKSSLLPHFLKDGFALHIILVESCFLNISQGSLPACTVSEKKSDFILILASLLLSSPHIPTSFKMFSSSLIFLKFEYHISRCAFFCFLVSLITCELPGSVVWCLSLILGKILSHYCFAYLLCFCKKKKSLFSLMYSHYMNVAPFVIVSICGGPYLLSWISVLSFFVLFTSVHFSFGRSYSQFPKIIDFFLHIFPQCR